VALFLAVAGRADAATTIVVTTVADTVVADGACSLREAILAAKIVPGRQRGRRPVGVARASPVER